MPYDYSPFGFSFDVFDILFVICFALVIATFAVVLVKNLSTWHQNNRSPRLSVPAEVVSKRMDVSYHHHTGASHMHHTSSSTWYYATFQVESGDRIELSISGQEYGMLAEGDRGTLTFQGTRFLSFERA